MLNWNPFFTDDDRMIKVTPSVGVTRWFSSRFVRIEYPSFSQNVANTRFRWKKCMQKPKFISTFYGSRDPRSQCRVETCNDYHSSVFVLSTRWSVYSVRFTRVRVIPDFCQHEPTLTSPITYATRSRPCINVSLHLPFTTVIDACLVSADVKSFMSNLLNVPCDLAVGLPPVVSKISRKTCLRRHDFLALDRSSRRASPWTVHRQCPVHVSRRPGMQPRDLLKRKRSVIARTRKLVFRHALSVKPPKYRKILRHRCNAPSVNPALYTGWPEARTTLAASALNNNIVRHHAIMEERLYVPVIVRRKYE